MEAMKGEHPVMEMADALEVSASGYAEHLKKDERPRRREDRELGHKLTAIFKANRKTYGAPRLQINTELIACITDMRQRVNFTCARFSVCRMQRVFACSDVLPRMWLRW